MAQALRDYRQAALPTREAAVFLGLRTIQWMAYGVGWRVGTERLSREARRCSQGLAEVHPNQEFRSSTRTAEVD